MPAVVTEIFPRLEPGRLIYDAVSLHHDGLRILLPDDPFTTTDGHGALRIVGDGDEIQKRMWAILWGVQIRHIEDFIHGDNESR